MATLLATTEKIAQVIYRGQVYESVYTPDRIQNRSLEMLQNALIKLYKASLELMAHTRGLLTKSTPHKILNSIISPDETSGYFSTLVNVQADLSQIVETCEVERSVDADDTLMKQLHLIRAPLARIDLRVEACLKYMNYMSAVELLEWISKIPHTKIHKTIQEERTPKTGDWLVQHQKFREWEEGSLSAALWLRGSRRSLSLL
jgi:ankyrin repeat domain-containing protein 50